MRAAFFLALLFIAASALPTSSQQENADGGSHTSQPAGNPNRPDSGSQAVTTHFVPGQKIDSDTYRAVCQSPKDREHADLCQQWRVAQAAETQIMWTVLGFFALLGTLIYTGMAASASKQAAQAARDSADAIPKLERAYVFIDASNNGRGPSAINVTFNFVNHGKTPAIFQSLQVNTCVAEIAPGSVGHTPNQNIDDESVLSPGQRWRQMYIKQTFSDQERIMLGEGKTSIWFWGSLRYSDVFGVDHITRFRWRYDGETFAPSGGVPYNERT